MCDCCWVTFLPVKSLQTESSESNVCIIDLIGKVRVNHLHRCYFRLDSNGRGGLILEPFNPLVPIFSHCGIYNGKKDKELKK